MHYLTILIFFLSSIGLQPVQGQSKGIDHTKHRHRLSGTEFYLNIPPGFTPGKTSNNEFVNQEKGTVLKLAFVENISFSTFCDSLTDNYFTKQGLREMQVIIQSNLKIYKGKFDIEKVTYFRTFYVYPYKNSTIVGIANYPEKLYHEFEPQFLAMFNTEEHE